MAPSSEKGNNPELWNKLIHELDEKLQLGLLDHLKRIASYHFEDDVLYVEPGTPEDEKYLNKDSALQQLQLLAQVACKVERVKIKKRSV
ncbi:MAG: hypothetical protein J0M12_11735 [Deltaproteobacteria bacterium]|nr:hypothetical protein [Deltaproteobacteria bacterium]